MSKYKKMLIFCFSGTGNSLHVAQWLEEYSRGQGLECELKDISDINVKTVQAPDEDTLLVFISPIHGFNYPKPVLDFIRKFPQGNADIALLATRGGSKMGKRFTPGLSGAAFFYNSFVLKRKGYSIVAQIPFDMPANCLALYPAQKPEAIKLMYAKNYKLVNEYGKKLLAGEKIFKARKDIVQDILITPVAIAYYLGGRLSFAKTFYATNDCTLCGKCIEICPFKAVHYEYERPYWSVDCQSCMKCMNSCPTNAIEVSHGLVLVTFLVSLLVSFKFCSSLLAGAVVFFIVFVPIQLVLYEITHQLLRKPKINDFITRFSLSHKKFWGRYKLGSAEERKK